MADFLWGCLIAALAWTGGMAGVLFGDWRDRRAGRPIDRGGFDAAVPGDPDY